MFFLKRLLPAIIVVLALWGATPDSTRAQGCGQQNPNCIVPTAPPGTSNNQAASTAFVLAELPSVYTGLTGDCTATSLGVITCTKTNGAAFGPLATVSGLSGDCTTTSLGVVTCAKLQNVPVTTTGASTNDVLTYNGTGWLHSSLITLFNSVCSLSPSSCAGLFGFNNVKWYGATGNCSTDDTTAFQNAWNASAGSSGLGKMWVPATTSCYLVTKINGTGVNNVIIEGTGDQSLIKINGDDANGNWWDLSGSNNVGFRNLKFEDNGSAVRIAFLWACTGTSCGTSGVLGGLTFDHVNVNAKFTLAGLYGYGFGVLTAPSFAAPSGALGMTNGTWVNTNNPGSRNGEETRTAPIMLTAYNAGAVRSVYQTLTTSTAIANQAYFANFNAIDNSTTGSTLSNGAAMTTDGVNQFTMIAGSLQCLCIADFIGWTSDEGVVFVMTAFEQPNGTTACSTLYWMEYGGGLNGVINLQAPFWSCNGTGGAYIALDAGIAAANGGIEGLTVMSTDPGLNSNNVPFIGKTAAGCGSFTATNNWIFNSNIQLLTGANNIVTCGSIDIKSFIQNAGTITVPSGATDHGAANPFR